MSAAGGDPRLSSNHHRRKNETPNQFQERRRVEEATRLSSAGVSDAGSKRKASPMSGSNVSSKMRKVATAGSSEEKDGKPKADVASKRMARLKQPGWVPPGARCRVR